MIYFLTTLLLSPLSSIYASFQEDLQFIYKTVLSSHPGVHNESDRRFGDKMTASYWAARTDWEVAELEDIIILSNFCNRFKDRNFWLSYPGLELPSLMPKSFDIKTISANLIQINIPTFDLTLASTRDSFNQLISQLEGMDFNETTIIFNLEGNEGGSSQSGTELLSAIFAKDWVNFKILLKNQNVHIDWCASRLNQEYAFTMAETNPDYVSIAKGIRRSTDANFDYYREYLPIINADNEPHTVMPVVSKILIITDEVNIGAALDFIDNVRCLDIPTILVGEQTGSDQVYMESQSIDLPSGTGTVHMPIKVYRNRMRKDAQPYTPKNRVSLDDKYKLQVKINAILNSIEENVG